MRGQCVIEGCGSKELARGLCNAHYHASRRKPPTNPCECGCGELAAFRFVSGHNTRTMPPEEQQRRGRMNNGEALRDRGAGLTYRKVGQRHEHRRVTESVLGRPLMPDEIVHHKNGNKRDNRPENLEVMTRQQHVMEHIDFMQQRRREVLKAGNRAA